MSYLDLITKENFGPYADIPEAVLTEEEKADAFAFLFDLPEVFPSEENIMALLPGHEVDPSVTIAPSEGGKLFAPGYLECENGYCCHPDGYGFSATRVDMPGVTPEMLFYFMQWFPQAPVHYKAWFPGMHVDTVNTAKGHSSWEDLGWGVKIAVLGWGPPITPMTYGIQNPREKDPDFVLCFGGTNAMSAADSDIEGNDLESVTMTMNYFRRKGDGLELRVRNWVDVGYRDGEYVLVESKDPVPQIDRTRLLATHNAWEWTHTARLAPLVYEYAKEHDLLQMGNKPPFLP